MVNNDNGRFIAIEKDGEVFRLYDYRGLEEDFAGDLEVLKKDPAIFEEFDLNANNQIELENIFDLSEMDDEEIEEILDIPVTYNWY